MLARLRRALRSIAAGFMRWFGGDPPAKHDPAEARAYRIFRAIMTETCEQCMAPLTVCRRSHRLADRYLI